MNVESKKTTSFLQYTRDSFGLKLFEQLEVPSFNANTLACFRRCSVREQADCKSITKNTIHCG